MVIYDIFKLLLYLKVLTFYTYRIYSVEKGNMPGACQADSVNTTM